MPPLTDLHNSGHPADDSSHSDPPTNPHDLPPESFWVSASDELDWLDQNTFIQRKGSIKLAITKNSQRSFSFNNNKPKASIIGPPKSQKLTRQSDNRELFKSRSESGKDRVHQLHEPCSPSVSCMGRVGSRKGCNRKRFGFWAKVRDTFVSRPRQNKCPVNMQVERTPAN